MIRGSKPEKGLNIEYERAWEMTTVKTASGWRDFEIIAAGDGEKLERWGEYTLRRPEPQAVWPMDQPWPEADAVYHRSKSGGGQWEFKRKLPRRWEIGYGDLKFNVEPTGFKHTGLFPEQAANWDYMTGKIIKSGFSPNVLNLFAYTGGATTACAAAGASVCHVDAAKGMVSRAKENLELSGLGDKPVRFLVDDAVKFVKREIRRGNKYDAVIMDPPSYGRGPSGELWKIEDTLFELTDLCSQALVDNPLFVLINSYATSLSPVVAANILDLVMKRKFGGDVEAFEIGLDIRDRKLVLPCGFTGRWERKW